MKQFYIIIYILFFSTSGYGQFYNDSIRSNTLSTKNLILPTSLILGGTILHLSRDTKYNWQNSIRAWNPTFDTEIDNYIQYLPIATMYGADIAGIHAQNTPWNQTKYLILSELASAIIVHTTKFIIKEPRPMGNNHSFPSGHTTQTFVGATVLYHEYKDSNPWIAYSGYTVAGIMGYMRVMNNAHWISDVITGAGLGILATNLIYHYRPLHNWNPFHKPGNKLTISPSINTENIGVAITMQIQ